MHAPVAKGTFGSENVKKHLIPRALLEVLMSKNCTPLWRKAHLEVKMFKNCSPRSTFSSSDVEKLHDAVGMCTSSVCRFRLHLGNVAFWYFCFLVFGPIY